MAIRTLAYTFIFSPIYLTMLFLKIFVLSINEILECDIVKVTVAKSSALGPNQE